MNGLMWLQLLETGGVDIHQFVATVTTIGKSPPSQSLNPPTSIHHLDLEAPWAGFKSDVSP